MRYLVSCLLLVGTAVLDQFPIRQSETPLRRQKQIVGGEFIPVHHLPYQAVIRSDRQQCGAILIAPQWVLTAEHCLRNSSIHTADVLLGVSRLGHISDSFPIGTEDVVTRGVADHFSPVIKIGNQARSSDLMLIKLDRKVKTSLRIKPIGLPSKGDRWTDQTAVVSGFGWMHPDPQHLSNIHTKTLQYIKVPILSKIQCLSMYRKKFSDDHQKFERVRHEVAPEWVLCAGIDEKDYNTCLGDSGGPLAVCVTPLQETSGERLLCEDNRWLLAGVVLNFHSSTRKCAEPNTPAVYSNVSVFSEWIRQVIREN